MKKINKYIKLLSVTLATVVVSTSCNDFLDKDSSGTVLTPEAVQNYTDANATLIGLYDGIQGNSDDITYYGANMVYYGDVRADWMQSQDLGKRTSPQYEMKYTASNAPAIWAQPYKVIRRANNLINSINQGKADVGAPTPADVDNLKGQALAIRALCHFDLLRIYSQTYTMVANPNAAASGIPIVIDATQPNSNPGRNTIEEVYTQVIKDLNEAYALMGTTKTPGFINKWGAQALLSRVYLEKGDNAKALTAAEDVINNSDYKLWANIDYAIMWPKQGTTEHMFELVNFDSNDWTDRNGLSYLISQYGYADYLLSKNAVEYFVANPNDVRGQLTEKSAAAGMKKLYKDDKVWCAKYPGREGGSDFRVNNIYVIRYSEVYLNAAEAAVKLGNPIAATYFNAIHKRSGNPSIATPTLDQVIEERAVEFLGEGQRFFDLMRNNKTVDRTNRYTYPLIDDSEKFNRTYFRTILPLPKSELDANPVLKKQQNPGY